MHTVFIIPSIFGAKAQEGQGKQNITTNQTAGFVVWEDPEGRFAIEYPSNWTTEGKTNRSDAIELQLSSPDTVNRIAINLFDKGETSLFRNSSLNDLCHNSIKNLAGGLAEFDIEEPLNFTKYTIGGHEACSLLFTLSSSHDVALGIVSLINGTEFNLIYRTLPESYDQTLPLINKIVNSIRVLKT